MIAAGCGPPRTLSQLTASSSSSSHTCSLHRTLERRCFGGPCRLGLHPRSTWPQHVVAGGSFNFAESGRTERVGRVNKTIEKKKADDVLSVVKGLCRMSNKQLTAVSHLLSAKQLEEISIAMRIPPTNQGRKRQEALVAKVLRKELDDTAMGKLATAVALAQQDNLLYIDRDVEQQLDEWMEGLVNGQQEVLDELQQLCQEASLDWSAIRTWGRQLQQLQVQVQVTTPAAAEEAATPGDEAAWSHLQPQRQQQQQQQQQQAARRSMNKARKALRGALRPLAAARAAES